MMPLDCIIATSYYSKLAFKCIWPLIAYAVFGVSSKLFRKCGKVDQADSCINFGFFVMFVIYPSVSSGWAACPPSRLFVLPSCIRGHACIRLASCTPGHAYPGLVSALIIIAQLAPNQAPVDVLLCGARGRHGMAACRPLPRVQHRSELCIRTNNLLSARSSMVLDSANRLGPDIPHPLLTPTLLVGIPTIRSHPFCNARLHLCHARAAHRGHATDLRLLVLLEASLRSAQLGVPISMRDQGKHRYMYMHIHQRRHSHVSSLS